MSVTHKKFKDSCALDEKRIATPVPIGYENQFSCKLLFWQMMAVITFLVIFSCL